MRTGTQTADQDILDVVMIQNGEDCPRFNGSLSHLARNRSSRVDLVDVGDNLRWSVEHAPVERDRNVVIGGWVGGRASPKTPPLSRNESSAQPQSHRYSTLNSGRGRTTVGTSARPALTA